MTTTPVSKGLYQWTRKLHLYTGLFISPFLLVYAVSTLYLNHSVRAKPVDVAQGTVQIQLDEGVEGMDLVNQVLEQLKISGEIAGRGMVRNSQTIIRVARPGTVKVVTVNIQKTRGDYSRAIYGSPWGHKLSTFQPRVAPSADLGDYQVLGVVG